MVYDAHATANILLAAAQKAGGTLASALKFKDELEYIQKSRLNGFLIKPMAFSLQGKSIRLPHTASEMAAGGKPVITVLFHQVQLSEVENFTASPAQFSGDGDFYFIPFVSPIIGEAGANKPWLQEVPDPTTTVMWNTWVEINPDTAKKLGVQDDDVVSITSNAGTVEASVYMYPAIRPDTIAMPFGQGHTAYGQLAQGRGVNPADLLSNVANEAGDLAFASMKVRVQKTGKKRQLSRMESILGVYGFNAKVGRDL